MPNQLTSQLFRRGLSTGATDDDDDDNDSVEKLNWFAFAGLVKEEATMAYAKQLSPPFHSTPNKLSRIRPGSRHIKCKRNAFIKQNYPTDAPSPTNEKNRTKKTKYGIKGKYMYVCVTGNVSALLTPFMILSDLFVMVFWLTCARLMSGQIVHSHKLWQFRLLSTLQHTHTHTHTQSLGAFFH